MSKLCLGDQTRRPVLVVNGCTPRSTGVAHLAAPSSGVVVVSLRRVSTVSRSILEGLLAMPNRQRLLHHCGMATLRLSPSTCAADAGAVVVSLRSRRVGARRLCRPRVGGLLCHRPRLWGRSARRPEVGAWGLLRRHCRLQDSAPIRTLRRRGWPMFGAQMCQ